MIGLMEDAAKQLADLDVMIKDGYVSVAVSDLLAIELEFDDEESTYHVYCRAWDRMHGLDYEDLVYSTSNLTDALASVRDHVENVAVEIE